jgi:hypothetical protein
VKEEAINIEAKIIGGESNESENESINKWLKMVISGNQ